MELRYEGVSPTGQEALTGNAVATGTRDRNGVFVRCNGKIRPISLMKFLKLMTLGGDGG